MGVVSIRLRNSGELSGDYLVSCIREAFRMINITYHCRVRLAFGLILDTQSSLISSFESDRLRLFLPSNNTSIDRTFSVHGAKSLNVIRNYLNSINIMEYLGQQCSTNSLCNVVAVITLEVRFYFRN